MGCLNLRRNAGELSTLIHSSLAGEQKGDVVGNRS